MRDGLIKSRKWIYVGLAVLAIASLFFPTMVMRVGNVKANFWLADVFRINAWFAVCWFVLWLVPATVIAINVVKGRGDNANLNTILFAVGVVLALIIYPIIMKLIMLQGAPWNTISFYLGVGGVLNGTFLVLGLALAVWSIVDNNLAKKKRKPATTETKTTVK